ncbi:hypothetical protein [Streptosporangium lutulentum]|uniref:DUF4352 domain-containing protein n=1 Tax=Streptosporangium lutulentum TaxID=1461250 RepID=A0ABT9Q325_9ACTN|nr:hypothetical protein [Streptosporangium lutulentum]MDP9841124.1 hypothetical protein [Streptosporangium lutulentum]
MRPSPTPSPTPTPSTLPAVGSTQETRDDDSVSKISALRIRSLKPISKALSRPGHEYLAFDVKLCVPENTREPVTAFAAPWMLSFADDSTTMASIASPSWFDVPIYPQVQAVRPGDCVRGWIPFEIPEDSEPRTLLYQPSTGNTLEWRLE